MPCAAPMCPISEALPAVFLNRKVNCGFEALALTPDEKCLSIGLQSPLLNPDKKIGDASLQTRILRMNLETKTIDAEWAYKFEEPSTVDPTTTTKASDLKISALVALNENIVLVEERTDNSFIVAQVSLSPGQSILGTAYDTSTGTTLEALKPTDSSLPAILPFKAIIFNSASVPELPKKIEGMAVENANTLAFINDNDNDNDFAFTYNTRTSTNVPTGVPTQFLYVTLAENLPTTPDVEARAAAKAAASKAAAEKPTTEATKPAVRSPHDGASTCPLRCSAFGHLLEHRGNARGRVPIPNRHRLIDGHRHHLCQPCLGRLLGNAGEVDDPGAERDCVDALAELGKLRESSARGERLLDEHDVAAQVRCAVL